MSPRFDDVCGVGARRALEADLRHTVFGACRVTEVPEGFIAQAPKGAALLGLEWEAGANASVAASPEVWFFQWLDAGGVRGAGLIAHLALVLGDWRVDEARCLALGIESASLLRHCGFRPWIEGPAQERHLLSARATTGIAYVRGRAKRCGEADCREVSPNELAPPARLTRFAKEAASGVLL